MTRTVRILRAVLCTYLLLWEPLNFTSEAFAAWGTLGSRSALATMELVVHAAFAMLSVLGGIALWNQSPHGVTLATLGICASTVRINQVRRFSMLPQQFSPDLSWVVQALALAHCLLWAAFLSVNEEQLTGKQA